MGYLDGWILVTLDNEGGSYAFYPGGTFLKANTFGIKGLFVTTSIYHPLSQSAGFDIANEWKQSTMQLQPAAVGIQSTGCLWYIITVCCQNTPTVELDGWRVPELRSCYLPCSIRKAIGRSTPQPRGVSCCRYDPPPPRPVRRVGPIQVRQGAGRTKDNKEIF
jgi:hypothetical protein